MPLPVLRRQAATSSVKSCAICLAERARPARCAAAPGQSPQMKDLSDLSKQLGVMGGVGAAVFGDRFEVGRDVEQDHLDKIQSVFDRFFGTQRS